MRRINAALANGDFDELAQIYRSRYELPVSNREINRVKRKLGILMQRNRSVSEDFGEEPPSPIAAGAMSMKPSTLKAKNQSEQGRTKEAPIKGGTSDEANAALLTLDSWQKERRASQTSEDVMDEVRGEREDAEDQAEEECAHADLEVTADVEPKAGDDDQSNANDEAERQAWKAADAAGDVERNAKEDDEHKSREAEEEEREEEEEKREESQAEEETEVDAKDDNEEGEGVAWPASEEY